MKLLLVFTFLALICIAQSAPVSSSNDRSLVLPDYHLDDETEIPDVDADDEMNTTTTTTTTTTRRSTYVFPTRNRNIVPTRRPWLTTSTTSIRPTTTREIEIDDQNGDVNDTGNDFNFFKNIREFFKKLVDDIKKYVKKITGFDLIKTIKQYFNKTFDY